MSKLTSKKLLTHSYISTDLAIIIPTKDRPEEVKRLLKSIAELDCKIGRIIIIATGMDIQSVVMSFANRIPVEYYSSEPGQIKQRNKGISLLDDSTKLVATMDDDTVFHKTSISEMINFWNSVETETAGVGFNIVNQPEHRHTWLKGVLGVSHPEPGKVLKSGYNTAICKIKYNIRSEWLNGGATVWRLVILKNNPHLEILSKWAVCEDLIFSYPIGKKYPLYVCASANIELEDVELEKQDPALYKLRGKTRFLWELYFVINNNSLSIYHFYYKKFLEICICLLRGVLLKQSYYYCQLSGMLAGLYLSLKCILLKHDIIKMIEANT